MKKILVLEDEASIRSFIVINLRRAGYDVIEAETGEEALERLRANPDTKVALLDIMLPGIDGFEVCRRIRATNTKIGIIMLTARSQEMDKVTGLMTGADDYVTKPFSPAELTARVDALFRRAGGEEVVQSGEISQPPFLLNTRNRTLEKNGQRVKLTQVEYAIMKLFMQNPGWIPEWLAFIRVTDEIHVALIYQLLILEFAIDGLRLAAVNTPSMLTTPLSVIAGIVLGEYSVKSGWFNSETMLYMAFVTIANYSMTSFELGYALKFMRVLLLILTFFLNLWGFIAGTLIAVGCLVFNRTIAGKSYIYPLIPFHWSELKKRLLRNRLPHEEKNG